MLFVITFVVGALSGVMLPRLLDVFAIAPPNIITYQGRILNDNGVPVSDATLDMEFRIFDALAAGTCLWSNSSSDCDTDTPALTTPRSVSLTDGLFTQNLGDTGDTFASIPDTVFDDNATLYLEIEIEGETLSPRKRITAAPFASNANSLDGLDSTDFLAASGDTGTGDYDLTGAIFLGASPLVLEGTTDDGFQTTLAVTDPTGANVVTLQDGTGTLAFLSDIGGAANLDDAYDNYGAVASIINVDAAEGQTGGLEWSIDGAQDFIVDLQSTGDFVVQDAGVDFFTFADDRTVDVNSTTDAIIFGINANSVTASNVFDINANGLTGGTIFNPRSSSAFSGDLFQMIASGAATGNAFRTVISNASASANAYVSENDGTGSSFIADQDGNTGATVSDSDGGAIHVGNTGNNNHAITAYTNNGATAASPLVFFHNDSTANTQHVLGLQGDGTGSALFVDQNGDTGLTFNDTAGGALHITNTANDNVGLSVYSNNASGQTGPLTYLFADNIAFDGPVLAIQNDGVGIAADIAQVGNNLALEVSTSSTTSNTFNLLSSTTTSGYILNLEGGNFTDDTGLAVNIDVTETTETADILNIQTDFGGADNNVFRIEADGETFSDVGFTAGAFSTNYYDGSITDNDGNGDDFFDFNLGAAADTFRVLTGNLQVGNGTPNFYALGGEDAYIEGTLEVDDDAIFEGFLTHEGGAGEEFEINRTFTDGAAEFGVQIGVVASDTGGSTGSQIGLTVQNLSSTEGLDTMLELRNLDADDGVGTGILITPGGGGIATGINLSGTGIGTDISLQNTETIDNDTDDYITFTGAGGTDHDFRIQLSDTGALMPAIDSATRSSIAVLEDWFVGGVTETISDIGFSPDGDDLFVAGTAGIEGNIYTDGTVDALDFSCTDCLNFDSFEDSLLLDANTDIDMGNSFGLDFDSDISGGNRTNALLELTQANDGSNTSNAGLLQVVQADLDSASETVFINNDSLGESLLIDHDITDNSSSGQYGIDVDLDSSATGISGTVNLEALRGNANFSGTTTSNYTVRGSRSDATFSGTGTSSINIIGAEIRAFNQTASTVTDMYAIETSNPLQSSGSITNVAGVTNTIFTSVAQTPTISNLWGFESLNNVSGGTITTGGGFYGDVSPGSSDWTEMHGALLELSGGGTVTTSYGVRADVDAGTTRYGFYSDVPGGTTAWAFYSPNGTADSAFNDDVFIGGESETLTDGGFALDGDDLFVADELGVEGMIFSDTGLDVDANTADYMLNLFNDGNANTREGIRIQACADTNPSTACEYVHFFDGNGTSVGAIEGDGAGGVTNASAGADYAELFPGVYANFAAGDVLALDGAGNVQLASNDQDVIGTFSVAPNVLGNWVEDWQSTGNYVAVALLGQVPVNVNDEGGAIAIGDYITLSSASGEAMKMNGPGHAIGIALEAHAGGSGQIEMYVSPGWHSAGQIAFDGTDNTLEGDFVVSETDTADGVTQGYSSSALSFRGSGWNGASAQDVDMVLQADVTDSNDYRLSVRNDSGTEVAFVNDEGDLAISGRFYPSDQGTLQTDKYIFYDSSGGPGLDYMRTNAAGWSTGSYDFAEVFHSEDPVVAGEVVIFGEDNEHVKRSDGTTYDERIAGIVSTRPGFLAGEFNELYDAPIALSGRVPTFVSGENGDIAPGDPLTTSTKPGYAMKATEAGQIIGYAMEPFSGNTGVIIAFVRASYYDGGPVSEVPAANNVVTGNQGSFGTLDLSGALNLNGGSILSVGSLAGIGNTWSIDHNGNFTTRGRYTHTINSHQNEDVEVYTTYSRETTIQLTGSIELDGGFARVDFEDIDPAFNDVISPTAPYRVFLTGFDPTGQLYAVNRSVSGFDIRESNGASTTTVDFMVIAYHKDYEPEEPEEDIPEDPVEEEPEESVQEEEEVVEDPAMDEEPPVAEEPVDEEPEEEVVEEEEPEEDPVTEEVPPEEEQELETQEE